MLKKLLLMAVMVGVFLLGRASADQPRMQAALDHLQSAKANLELASADKGGHRAKALVLVQGAIEQVRLGIGFDRANRPLR